MRRPRARMDAVHAAVIGLAVAAAVAVGGLAMLRVASDQSLPALTEATTAAAESVGRAVADQIGRALGYGIPLDKLYAVDRYFDTVVAGSPIVEGLALRDPSGRVVLATAPGLSGLVFPITVGGAQAASLVLATAPPLVGTAIDLLLIALAANAVLFGLIGGAIAYQVLTGHFGAGRRRLLELMRAGLDDRYPAIPAVRGRGSVAVALRAYGRCVEELKRSARTLNDAVATVRAIDFDGSLARRLEPVVAPVAVAIAPDAGEGRAAAASQASGPWLAVVAVGLLALTAPFVANFAVDREWVHVTPLWWPVLPIVAEAVAGLIGFVLARRLLPGTRPLAAAAGLLAAGLATAAVAWERDYLQFVELRALAAAGVGLAAATLAGHAAAARERPNLLGPLLFAALLAGPLLGALLGESVGRRMAFLTGGCLMLALAPVVLALVRSAKQERAAAGGTRVARLLPASAAGVTVGAMLLVWVPAVPGYESYLTGGLLIATAGMGAALPLRSILAGGMLAAAGLSVAAYPEPGVAALFGAALLAGAGIRALLSAASSRPDVAVPFFAAGAALGAASVGAAGSASLPALAPAAVLSIALAGIAIATRQRTAAG